MKYYFTKRVKEELPIEVSFAMIKAMENIEVTDLDYLQIFKLEVLDKNILVINHSQEQPEYKFTYYITSEKEIYDRDLNGTKLYMIIENEYTTLMLAEEY